jgi:transcriptional regulator with XRE-family HTH domain
MARKTQKADDLDKYIGNRIKEQRENLGLTQGELAEKTDVSYQQIHKYERGTNRISAGRLGLIAEVLGIGVQSFYDGFAEYHLSNTILDTQDNRYCLELARNFRQIENPRHQEVISLLVRVLAN